MLLLLLLRIEVEFDTKIVVVILTALFVESKRSREFR